ncbi:IS66 family insertion sequence element accessory protein TnpB [Paracandidimonas lactea]|uniref:IS66 family insertion sequence element accessory protein TnpB n=1 Tax=Paracandidimonas lactea TaxID=2895524 RepID=UPI001F3E43A8|nr:IS66 family insertion sequence element accessory protein TnpB [Paracandidimonas lactea]
MIGSPKGAPVRFAAGAIDRRRDFNGLAAIVQAKLEEDSFSGHVFVFKSRKEERIKMLWWSGDGMCMMAQRRAG